MGLVATMTALLLGLVTASAKTTFDEEDAAVKSGAASILTVDRMLARYGPETHLVRESIHQLINARLDAVWPEESVDHQAPGSKVTSAGNEVLVERILALQPQTETQSWYRSQVLATAAKLLESRALFGSSSQSAPTLFVIVMICWLTLLFASFCLFAPSTPTVVGAVLVGSLSVAASLFLILEMTDPYVGIMKISSDPLRYVAAQLGK
jgi:hypothetical protein